MNIKEYKKQYYLKNKEKIDSDNKQNYYANKSNIDEIECEFCFKKFTPKRIDNKLCSNKCGMDRWRLNNKDYIKKDQNNRYHNDLNRKISTCFRSRLNKALKGNVKSKSTIELVGCSIEQLKKHIESQFEPWMNWDNHGPYNASIKTWHIDHIKPMGAFDLSIYEQQKEACCYTNIRPMLAIKNLIKGAKYENV